MVSFSSALTAAFTVLSILGGTQAVPLADKLRSLSPLARDVLKRATPGPPHFVTYSDLFLSQFPSTSQLRGFNVFALSFLTISRGALDQARVWGALPPSQRSSLLKQYNNAGISVIVSAFGSTETPTSSGVNPVTAANTMANWVKGHNVNGIDVDYEDLAAFNKRDGSAENWLISFTRQLRRGLPEGQFILTHAPVAPWFSPSKWNGRGYLDVHRQVGSMIDWYNVQFYNQGTHEYTTCQGLLTGSSSVWPQTALFQIAANGVDRNKLVIGKPAIASDATNGFMDRSTLASCVSQAVSRGWRGGVMVWQYPHSDSSWITTVRGRAFPLALTEDSTTPEIPMTDTDVCDDISAWEDSVQYTEGSKVRFHGHVWIANIENPDEAPEAFSGIWTRHGKCI